MSTAASSDINGAQAIVRMLEAYGVKHVFGVPGDTSVLLYQALYERRDAIAHVLARDERSAGFMADVYARLSHARGVRVPVRGRCAVFRARDRRSQRLLDPRPAPDQRGQPGRRGQGHHHRDGPPRILRIHFQVVQSFSSWLMKIPETLRRAFRVATSGCPGAVHLAFPTETVTDRIPLAADFAARRNRVPLLSRHALPRQPGRHAPAWRARLGRRGAR